MMLTCIQMLKTQGQMINQTKKKLVILLNLSLYAYYTVALKLSTASRLHVCIHMHKRGKWKTWERRKKTVFSSRLCVNVSCVCVGGACWVAVCVWECYWEIFLILCVSSSHLPQQEMLEGSWITFPVQIWFKHTLTHRHTHTRVCLHAHTHAPVQTRTVSELFHTAPVASLKVKKKKKSLPDWLCFFMNFPSECLRGNFTWTRLKYECDPEWIQFQMNLNEWQNPPAKPHKSPTSVWYWWKIKQTNCSSTLWRRNRQLLVFSLKEKQAFNSPECLNNTWHMVMMTMVIPCGAAVVLLMTLFHIPAFRSI